MKDFFEDIAVAIIGSAIVILFCAFAWLCRLLGVRLEDEDA